MKKIQILLFLYFGFFMLYAQTESEVKKHSISISAGFNFAGIITKNSNFSDGTSIKSGVSTMIKYKYNNAGNVFLGTGIGYSSYGYKISYSGTDASGNTIGTQNIIYNMNYLEIPLHLSYQIKVSSDFSIIPQLSFFNFFFMNGYVSSYVGTLQPKTNNYNFGAGFSTELKYKSFLFEFGANRFFNEVYEKSNLTNAQFFNYGIFTRLGYEIKF